ncbi:uncharacterized protein EMH_0093710 [Eimeria mitis]|uniref:Uncharacterized protein n=1 Tax=Eimeria mitis TaxID=44415 RepID=U6KFA4_9EIME|nr:uncharacterized protein EMH_0093710 [Eimeria mitis]CDJ34907.1 hypothetical protein EMH_0093710 [Eimeria mitis]
MRIWAAWEMPSWLRGTKKVTWVGVEAKMHLRRSLLTIVGTGAQWTWRREGGMGVGRILTIVGTGAQWTWRREGGMGVGRPKDRSTKRKERVWMAVAVGSVCKDDGTG